MFQSNPRAPQNSTDAISLARILSSQANSHRICLNDCFIGDQGIKLLIPFLSEHLNISILELKGNNISPIGFAQLCEYLRLHSKLSSLICEWNNIGLDEQGLQNLSTLAQYNKNLIHIDLRNNKLGINEALIIGNMLKMNTSLLSLDLRWNEIGNKGMSYILSGLKENFTLIYLDIQGNNISGDIQQSIDFYLERNRAENKITKEDILANRRDNIEATILENNNLRVFKEKELNLVDIEKIDNPTIKEQALYLNKLDEMLRAERKINREISVKLDDEIERIRNKDTEDQNFIADYEIKMEKVIIENESLKRGINLLRKDVEVLQDNTSKSYRFEEDRLKHQQNELDILEKSHRDFMNKMADEHNKRIKDLNYDWEDHYKLIDNRIKDLQTIIIGLQSEENELNQKIREMTIQNEDDFHHLQQKLKDQEEIFNSFKLKELLQNLEHDRFHLMGIIRRNGNLANELKNLEDKLPNEMNYLEQDYAGLKQEFDVFFQKHQEFVLLLDKLKLELSMKESRREKFEKEIEDLKEKQKKKNHHHEKENHSEKHKKKEEKDHWIMEKEKMLEKIAELELNFVETSNLNLKLKNDRQKLLQLIQSSVSKTIYEVFTLNNVI